MKPAKSVFLERDSYRRRRMGDAAVLLPLFGTVLLVIPLLWQSGDGGARTTDVMLYIFGVWALLAGLARLVSGYLDVVPSGSEEEAVDRSPEGRG
ncbi:hypothetical protein KUD11_08980 [Roseovarius sp. LXJ103]|uniref:hypothetical protein n=1 Tax=Roseovarius carneus TaxID=2853164 RepID=UPI000D60C21A|nr:hypothetical protein [Roseovarius carneus]MBZ8118783.1 hypothetical protein [Roseovarius carneus]PWE35545.1 hypothetical protein DD563_05980 [Pelagicola sp. LXJ1103]